MPMQDVSNDQTMINWLRQSGHGHLIEDHTHNTQDSSSAPPTSSLNPLYDTTGSSSAYPPQSTSIASSALPSFMGGYSTNVSTTDPLNQSGSFARHDINQVPPNPRAISPAPPTISHNNTQASPLAFNLSPTRVGAPTLDDPQIDVKIENMRRDPNTRIIQRAPVNDVVYKQRVFVRYLQPPTPPVGGTIIVREKQEPGPPPDPPIVLKRTPPEPPTPPPVVIRERPPPMPAAEGTTVIDKLIPSRPKPPPQVIIEQYPQLPPKPQDVIIERWLPAPPRHRRILYERLPPHQQSTASRPIIVQYGLPHIRIQREVITTPGLQLPYQQITGHADINNSFNQVGRNQPIPSALNSSSVTGYNPNTALGPSYGIPSSVVSSPNQNPGLSAYGSGTSTVPIAGQTAGPTAAFTIPDNVPLDGVLRQLGVDPYSLKRSTGPPPSNATNAISNVWNAASHANQIDPNTAVSHVWNAMSHAPGQNQSTLPAAASAWDRTENYLHPPSGGPGNPSWNQNPQQNSSPPAFNYQQSPNQSNNYIPPSNNYPPPQGPLSNNYPPTSGGPTSSGSGVLSRLFGGG